MMSTFRDVIWRIVRFFLFQIDAERAHRWASLGIKVSLRVGAGPLRLLSGTRVEKLNPIEVLDLTFLNRVGLAAGFDKDGELLRAWPALGFGFCEIGTVTPRPQPGNERPRLFRDPSREALFNCMGFNNDGAENAAHRLAEARPHLPASFRVGANIGKNKDTPLARAFEDYRNASRPFAGLADYLVINVSSPNTPGLRDLQTVEALRPIVQETLSEVAGWKHAVPVLLKLGPELQGATLAGLLLEAERWGIGGWVLTNTVGGGWQSSTSRVTGGWSGTPAREVSRASLQTARTCTRLPIISVGGIDCVEEARARIVAGADLVQMYTSFVYEGPSLPGKIARNL